MDCTPDFDGFRAAYDQGQAQPVWTTLPADLETPVSAFLKLTQGGTDCFLLESVEGGHFRGRYSFLGLAPDVIWRATGRRADINHAPARDPDGFAPCPDFPDDPLQSLRRLERDSRMTMPAGLPPMAAGLVGYMSYDMIRLVENIPDANPAPAALAGMPDGLFVRPTLIAVFDTIRDVLMLVTPVRPAPDLGAMAAYEAALQRLSAVADTLARPIPAAALAGGMRPATAAAMDTDADTDATSNLEGAAYQDMVLKAKEYILAGDIFQVVLSQRFEMPFPLPPFSLYRALRRLNPSPFLFFLSFRDFAVTGSSPEILVRLRDGKVTIRPIAGTRPRGATPAEDQALERELLADPKERAEHLMLLDLGRNDAGRVAKIGSVRVSEQFVVERYSHVMHIVSNVEGMIDPAHDGLGALMAGFPAGTVSGAPKVRAMQIIDELEPERRGVYAGCIGYFGADGSMDSCIALRTAVIRDGRMIVQAGAGIVADSDPVREDQECRDKARALVRAAQTVMRANTGGGGN